MLHYCILTEKDNELTSFFDAIEYCRDEYEEPGYITPANELNNLIEYYKTQVKTNATRSKAGEEVD